MRNLIIGISCILLFGSYTNYENLLNKNDKENCGCELTNNIESFVTEIPPTKESLLQQKELTEKEIKYIAGRLCSDLHQSDAVGFSEERFKRIIAIEIGVKVNNPKINLYISEFLNKYSTKMVCPPDNHKNDNRFKHLYKSAMLKGITDLFDKILLNEDEFTIDFNIYEIVDNKKETLLDYIDKLIASNKFDKKELQIIQMEIEDLGGKRGAELD